MQAVFLDRDGVINENRADHVTTWEGFRLLPGALDALALLTRNSFRIFVVTNQACINRGLVERTTVERIHLRLTQIAGSHGARIEDVRLCPHRPDEGCGCRKPRPGMLLDLAHCYGLDLGRATLIGDALSDIAAGQAAGCATILVRSGRGADQERLLGPGGPRPGHIAADLLSAARWLCQCCEEVPTPC